MPSSLNITLKKQQQQKNTVAITLCRFRFMWRKHPNFVETGITLIRSLWPNSVPMHLDAVYQNVQRNVILFFKGNINELKVTSSIYVFRLRVITKKSDGTKRCTSYLHFFSSPGQQYWMLRQLDVQEGFPRNISSLGFPSRITSVDAALHLRNDHTTVFFTGHECWRYLNRCVFLGNCSRRDVPNSQW